MNLRKLQSDLRKLANPKDAEVAQRFFKTGPGEYGEGDVFLGIRVPVLRRFAKDHRNVTVDQAGQLLKSRYHEERLFALFLLIQHASRGDEAARKRIYQLYLDHTDRINNWDLVDLSAPQLVGMYLLGRSRKPLYRLARSRSLWERRIAILATFCFIKHDDFEDTLKVAEILLRDQEDLIHKAVGWMLREVGNRDLKAEEAFLKQHVKDMPRTMLRYAIEKFPEAKRQRYLKGRVRGGNQGS